MLTEESRQNLMAALIRATVPLASGSGVGTGFQVAPELIVTCTHVVKNPRVPVRVAATHFRAAGEATVVPNSYLADVDLVLLRTAEPAPYVLLAEPVQPGDELWTYGYPEGNYRSGDSVFLRADGPSERRGARLLKATAGRAGRGHSGGPVLNWRTGAVCGVITRSSVAAETARLIPTATLFECYPALRAASEHAVDWLGLLDDRQLAACELRHPGPLLRDYLTTVSVVDEEHPYAGLLDDTPPLSAVYLPQLLNASHLGERSLEEVGEDANDVFGKYLGVQIIDWPGAGKSSLVKHVAATKAKLWLDRQQGDAVPLPIHADALTASDGLTEMLAAGFQDFVRTTTLDKAKLSALFASEPLPGVPWLVLVDGLDEIPDPQTRAVVVHKISRYRQDETLYQFVVTTRPLEQVVVKLSDPSRHPNYTLKPFTYEQLVQLMEKWLHAAHHSDPGGSAARFMYRLEHTKLHDIATIPLIATMLCIVYSASPDTDLPYNRAELYEQFIDLLLAKHRRLRNVRAVFRDWVGQQVADDLLASLPDRLRSLAFKSQERGFDKYSNAHAVFGARVPHGQDASTQPPNVPPKEWQKVTNELLRGSGLVVEHRGEFRFIHRTIEEYLAAKHVVARYPNPSSRSARKILAPQQSWPWTELEVRTFIAALWARSHDLTKCLVKLLNRRNRLANVWFVLQLHHQGILLPSQIRSQLVKALAELVADHRVGKSEWIELEQELRSLDNDRAIDAFKQTLGKRHIPWDRQCNAALLLAELRHGLGRDWLVKAVDIAANRVDRLRAATTLLKVDHQAGVEKLAKLAISIEMEDLQIDAAVRVLEVNRAQGLDLLQIVANAAEGRVCLQAARTLAGYDRVRGLEALTALSRRQSVDDHVRYETAEAIEDWSPGARTPLMLAIADDGTVSVDWRIQAATRAGVEDIPGAVRALSSMVDDKAVEPANKVIAADAAAQLDNESGLRVLLELVVDPAIGRHALSAGERAGQVDSSAAAQALYQLSRQERASDDLRLEAAQAAGQQSPDTGVAALRELATSIVTASTKVRAAAALVEFDRSEAVELLVSMTEAHSWSPQERIAAGIAVGRIEALDGKRTLTRLAHALPQGYRVRAAQAVAELDRDAGIDLLGKIGRSQHNRADTRCDAAQALERLSRSHAVRLWTELAKPGVLGPRGREQARRAVERLSPAPATNRESAAPSEHTDVLKAARAQPNRRRKLAAYRNIITDRSNPGQARIEALEEAAKLDARAAVRLARDLSRDRRLSRSQRQRAQKIVERYS